MKERIHIEPPRPNHPGQFLPGVTWEGERVEDLNELIKTIKYELNRRTIPETIREEKRGANTM